jgi:hypothetical protein
MTITGRAAGWLLLAEGWGADDACDGVGVALIGVGSAEGDADPD